MLLQKRLDTSKWPLGDSGQGPGAIRYLTDGQGNIIALLTTSINPNDPEPIGPGSAEKAAEVDPTIRIGGNVLIPYTITAKVNPVFITLVIEITGTNTIMSAESPAETDYSVPTGKVLLVYKWDISSSVATSKFALGYGDDGVAEGTVDPTNPVWLIGRNNAGVNKSAYETLLANETNPFNISAEIPAGKFPFVETIATSGNKQAIVYGVEVDA